MHIYTIEMHNSARSRGKGLTVMLALHEPREK